MLRGGSGKCDHISEYFLEQGINCIAEGKRLIFVEDGGDNPPHHTMDRRIISQVQIGTHFNSGNVKQKLILRESK